MEFIQHTGYSSGQSVVGNGKSRHIQLQGRGGAGRRQDASLDSLKT